MASGYPGAVSASQIGSYFVGQYYQVLQQQPDFAHQFYTDASNMIRVDGDSTESASSLLTLRLVIHVFRMKGLLALLHSAFVVHVIGLLVFDPWKYSFPYVQQIHTLVMSLNFTEIEIKTINCLESWSGGVLVVVSGIVKAKDFSGRRKFVQTFVLAPQEKGYFVLNDIFHVMDEDVVHQHTVPALLENRIDPQRPNSTPISEPPVPDYGFEEEASEFVNSVHIDGDDEVDDYSGEDQQPQQLDFESETELEETPAEDLSGLLHKVVEAEPEPVHSVEEPVGEPPKLTYASILRAAKGPSVPSVTPRPSFTKSTPPASEWHHPQPAALPSIVPESRLEVPEENPSLAEEGELKSVYVRNLPSTVSAADIEQEFKTFGRITADGVFIRNRKDLSLNHPLKYVCKESDMAIDVQDIGVCYAFVEFEDLQAVQNAVKASPIQLAGKTVYIEERRANSSGVAFRGRGRGRGSYQSDTLRGRVGGRGSGRGNQDGGDFNKSRGNGFRGGL
ncbi:hypothetical protein RHMOL_Rhmol13G0050100 [Rhododendron molle]|uniref:Uncharacterized protein n=2 Tax=Rhododendron molle TaxID=49168 RepID=A0ACC0L309_RHOML|nr:hypothetical protein RHMOL_Rhmol13G0050100 [Rhododendron molle]KAI8523129.1 hypothetical protein RHMOL_Rhmol13G0050100 [Rhododendron molle]